MTIEQSRELDAKQLEQVHGGAWANVAGAVVGGVAGAVGGFYGGIISGGTNATGWDIAKGVASGFTGGAVAGAFNPVGTVVGAIKVFAIGGGTGAVGGGAAHLIDEVRRH